MFDQRLSPTRKVFKGDHWIVPEMKKLVTQTNHNKNFIFLIADIALRYTVKTSFTNLHKSIFSSGSYSCLPIKVWESEVYAKHVVQSFEHELLMPFFRKNLSLDTLAVTKIYTKFLKGKIRFSHIPIIWQKHFIIHQLHKKSSYNHLK